MTSQEVASGPVKSGVLLAEEVQQLFQYWYANEMLPGNFNTTRRHISAELHIARFGGQQGGWPYVAGRPNGIKLCVTSVLDKANRNVDLASINLVAVGVYLSSGAPFLLPNCRDSGPSAFCICVECVAYRVQLSSVQSSPTISLKVYIEERTSQKEMEECRQTFQFPAGETRLPVKKIPLEKIVPLKMNQRYTILADITGIMRSHYGTEGKSSITMPTSSVEFNVTVQFSSVSELDGGNVPAANGGVLPSGITTIAQGQLPEFYFEVLG